MNTLLVLAEQDDKNLPLAHSKLAQTGCYISYAHPPTHLISLYWKTEMAAAALILEEGVPEA